MNSEVKNTKYVKFLEILLNILIFSSLVLLLAFFTYNNFLSSEEIFSEEIESCQISKFQIENNKKITFELENLPLFPEYENTKCLSKVTNIQKTNIVDTYKPNIKERYIVYVATNILLYKSLNYILNGFLIILILRFFDIFKSKILILYFAGNTLIHSMFNSYEPFLKVLLPFTHPEKPEDQYLFSALFFFIFVLKSKSNNLFLITLYICVFFIPDFLGILVLLFYIFKKGKIESFDSTQKKILKLLPIIFFISRFVFSLIPGLKFFWNIPAMRFFQGDTKFYDLLWNLETMRCIYEPTYFDNNVIKMCRDLTGGLLDDYLYITTDPTVTTFILIGILLALLIWIYLLIVRKYPDNIFFISILFISPSFNFLTYIGNIDLMYFCLIFLLFFYTKKMYILKILVLFFFTLYNTHPLGALIGFSIYLFKNKLYRYFFLGSLLSMGSIGLILTQISSIQNNFVGTIEASFGIQYFLSRFTNFNLYIGLSLVLLIVFVILSFAKFEYQDISNDLNFNNGYLEVVTYWFLFSSLFYNNSYRLALFGILFLLIFRKSNKKIKISILVFVLFIVTPVTVDYYFQVIFWITKILSFSVIFTYISGYFLEDLRYLFVKKE